MSLKQWLSQKLRERRAQDYDKEDRERLLSVLCATYTDDKVIHRAEFLEGQRLAEKLDVTLVAAEDRDPEESLRALLQNPKTREDIYPFLVSALNADGRFSQEEIRPTWERLKRAGGDPEHLQSLLNEKRNQMLDRAGKTQEAPQSAGQAGAGAVFLRAEALFVTPSGDPLIGTEISAHLYDRDLLLDDHLAESRLGEGGQAQFFFALSDMQGFDGPLEEAPDVYLVLRASGREIFRSPTVKNLPIGRQNQVTHEMSGATVSLGTFVVGF